MEAWLWGRPPALPCPLASSRDSSPCYPMFWGWSCTVLGFLPPVALPLPLNCISSKRINPSLPIFRFSHPFCSASITPARRRAVGWPWGLVTGTVPELIPLLVIPAGSFPILHLFMAEACKNLVPFARALCPLPICMGSAKAHPDLGKKKGTEPWMPIGTHSHMVTQTSGEPAGQRVTIRSSFFFRNNNIK